MQLPLTFQQQWLLDLLQKYRDWNCAVAYAFRLQGSLDVPILRRSLEDLVQRHGSLRTRIVMVDGIPAQETEDPSAGRFEVTLVDGPSATAIEERARQIFAEFSEQKADPCVGPLLGVSVLKLAEREHWLFLALHRLTADCFSSDQIFRELWLIYRGFLQNQLAPLEAQPTQYGEYALWQHSTAREWARRHAAYWKGRLDWARGLKWPPDPLAVGTAGARNARMSGLFDATLSNGLRDLARRSRALLGTVMLAVYVATLYQWCRQKDFVIPFNIAGRQSEQKYVVGYFSHVLYLRMQLTGEETFSELLSSVSNEFFRALMHQDFGRMALQEPQLLTGTYFQWVAWHGDAASEHAGPAGDLDLVVERLPLGTFGEGITALPPGTVDVDLTFFDTPSGIYAAGWYRGDLFSAATMERFIGDLRATAERFVSTPAGK